MTDRKSTGQVCKYWLTTAPFDVDDNPGEPDTITLLIMNSQQLSMVRA
jgi:hypothetical protein